MSASIVARPSSRWWRYPCWCITAAVVPPAPQAAAAIRAIPPAIIRRVAPSAEAIVAAGDIRGDGRFLKHVEFISVFNIFAPEKASIIASLLYINS